MKNSRWIHNYDNFRKSLGLFKINVAFVNEIYFQHDYKKYDYVKDAIWFDMPDLYKQGLVKSFECTFDMAWRLFKDHAEENNKFDIKDYNQSIAYALKQELIQNKQLWKQMIESKTLALYSFQLESAMLICDSCVSHYLQEFQTLKETLNNILNDI